MTTIITKYKCEERQTGSPDIDIEAKADDKHGDILMSIVIRYPDGHQSIVSITVDYNKAYVATDLKVDRCCGKSVEDDQCESCGQDCPDGLIGGLCEECAHPMGHTLEE